MRFSLFCAAIAVCGAGILNGAETNILPDGNFENKSIMYRGIGNGTCDGTVSYDPDAAEGSFALKVENISGGNFHAYSGQVIELNQDKPYPITVSFQGKRAGNGRTLVAVDMVLLFNDGSRVYWLDGLTVDHDTDGKWVERKAQYHPDKPVKAIEVWPILNGEACTAWFDDIRVIVPIPAAEKSAVPTWTMENEFLRLELEQSDGRVGVSAVTDRVDGTRFLVPGTHRMPNLWSVKFRLSDLQVVSVEDGNLARVIAPGPGESTWKLQWQNLAIPHSDKKFDLTVTVAFAADRAEADWHIEVDGGEEILEVTFPRLSGIGPLGNNPEDDFVALPEGSGVLLRNYATVGTVNLAYASGASMQFFSFYDGDGGLYLATHDGDMLAKDYSMARQLDNSLSFQVSTFPAGTIVGRTRYEQSYPLVMRLFRGDWFDAAQIYRQWALEQNWCREPGPLRQRINPTLDAIDVWMKCGSLDADPYSYSEYSLAAIARLSPEERQARAGVVSPDATAGQIEAFATAVAPAGLGTWYTDNWHCGGCLGIDAVSPEYQARRGFTATVTRLRGEGIPVMPYTNFGRWDVDLGSYPPEAMIRNADMAIRTYPSHRTLTGAMCHDTAIVENLWSGIAVKLADYGCNAVYLDELSTNGNPVCYAATHRHAPGDSAARIRAQRHNILAMKQAVRDKAPDFFTMGEQGCEVYIGANDINLWWSASRGEEDIPLFEAVYHDYSIGMGRVPGKWYGAHVESGYSDRSGGSGLEELAINIGKCFVHGLQIGTVRQDMASYAPEGTRMVADTANLHRKLRPYLHYGRMLRAPQILAPTARMAVAQAFLGFLPTLSLPVLNGAFQAEDGTVAAVFFNITGKEQKLFWQIDPCNEWLLPPGNYQLTLLTPAGEDVLGVVAAAPGTSLTFELALAAFAPAAVRWEPVAAAPTPGFGQAQPPQTANGVQIELHPRMTSIKAGDTLWLDGVVANPTAEAVTVQFTWVLPPQWQLLTAPEALKLLPGEHRSLEWELSSGRNEYPVIAEVRVSADTGNFQQQWQIELRKPRAEYVVSRADTATLEKLRAGILPPDGAWLTLSQPAAAHFQLDGIEVRGQVYYDDAGLYFLFRVTGENNPVRPALSEDIWKGDCMQIAFDGKRLNANYTLSLALAETVSGPGIFDFLANRTTQIGELRWYDTPDGQYYFFHLPWKELGYTAPPKGKCIGFSATYNHHNGHNFVGFLEWTPGICGGTQPNEFGNLQIKE